MPFCEEYCEEIGQYPNVAEAREACRSAAEEWSEAGSLPPGWERRVWMRPWGFSVSTYRPDGEELEPCVEFRVIYF
jgi:hypothetical protein